MDDNTTNQSFYTPTELRNVFRLLWSQYVMWTRFFIISKLSNLGDIEVVTNRLLESPSDFSNVLKIYYGDTLAEEFEYLFREHLIITTNLVQSYLVERSNGDTLSKIAETEKKWYENASQLSIFLSRINPNFDQVQIQSILYNHLDMTKDEFLKRLNNQYYADVYLYDFIEYHILMLADIIANGIIKQFYV